MDLVHVNTKKKLKKITRVVTILNESDFLSLFLLEDPQIMNKDILLDAELNFRIYEKRWNEYTNYILKITINGWIILKDGNVLKSKRNGQGAIFNILDEANVFYPKDGIGFALEKLWNQFSDKEIDERELQYKLSEIAIWISDVERYLRRNKPKWINF